ncbi:MAG: 5-bromo-4-chloroindolyl phosphate hydrolysis family protein [Geminicoccaceae bacterium]
MQEKGFQPAGSSRRVGGGRPTGALPALSMAPARGWLLKISACLFVWPLFLALLRGSLREVSAYVLAIVLLYTGGRLIERGSREELMNSGRALARSPTPWKLLGAVAAGAGAALASLGTGDLLVMGLVYGALVGGATVLTYGLDPKSDRAALEAAAKRAGIRTKEVLDALDEAHRKVRGIEDASQGLHSRELKARLDRICRQGRTILGQLEQDPRNLTRARRFLVTYLDGTRDVVAKYAAQQRDLADTALAENFRRVLTTVEQVFDEQEEVLKQDDRLDLEVQIEVLETQLKREGVH